MDVATTPVPAVRAGRPRRIAAAVCFGIPALAMLAFGGQLLVLGWTASRPGGSHHVHDLAWGAAEGILLLVPLLMAVAGSLRGRPTPAVLQQALAVLAALAAVMLLTLSPDPFTAVLAVLVLGGVLLTGRHAVRPGMRPRTSRALAVLAAVAAVALVPYALAAAAAQRAGDSVQAERLGYTGAAVWALALVAVVAVAAVRSPGWRVPALSASAAACVVGVASLVWPQVPSSLGRPGGLIALAWAVAVVVVVARTGRPSRAGRVG